MKTLREALSEVRSLETHPLVKKARKAHKDGVWDGNVDKEGNPIVHINGRPHTVKEDEELDEAKYTPKQYKMAFGVLNDPRWKGGNMTQIVSTIEKIAKGLSKDKAVALAIQVTNE